ncbi:hypothetical protein NB725_001555 [Pantoea ananatis]|nr:hypothetical protein [Pantoea ananatis]MCW0339128.1 hypothetical protein [Pantoea ananatis]MCW0348348.1 hypothetical protein [Pantoea ananatis]MCW0357322.1 hypothetical protein [Pantoea ananatis]MCW0361945.1 hypothetical protein [Pantoea ananatis]
MSIRSDHEKEFISLFNSIARGTRRLQVFTDFISCSVIAIQNGLQFRLPDQISAGTKLSAGHNC